MTARGATDAKLPAYSIQPRSGAGGGALLVGAPRVRPHKHWADY